MSRVDLIFLTLLLGLANKTWPPTGASVLATVAINGMASCRHRVNFYYNTTVVQTIGNTVISRCLLACLRNDKCKAFNYGNDTCWLLDDFLCSVESSRLTYAHGMRYFDLLSTPADEYEAIHSQDACRLQGRCDRRCVCMATDRRLPCKFPFIYNNGQSTKTYQACTMDKFLSKDDRYWCSIAVNSVGFWEPGDTGYCADWCPKTSS